MLVNIAERLRISISYDAINGTEEDRAVCEKQMREAADEIERLQSEVAQLRTTTRYCKCIGGRLVNGNCIGCGLDRRRSDVY